MNTKNDVSNYNFQDKWSEPKPTRVFDENNIVDEGDIREYKKQYKKQYKKLTNVYARCNSNTYKEYTNKFLTELQTNENATYHPINTILHESSCKEMTKYIDTLFSQESEFRKLITKLHQSKKNSETNHSSVASVGRSDIQKYVLNVKQAQSQSNISQPVEADPKNLYQVFSECFSYTEVPQFVNKLYQIPDNSFDCPPHETSEANDSIYKTQEESVVKIVLDSYKGSVSN